MKIIGCHNFLFIEWKLFNTCYFYHLSLWQKQFNWKTDCYIVMLKLSDYYYWYYYYSCLIIQIFQEQPYYSLIAKTFISSEIISSWCSNMKWENEQQFVPRILFSRSCENELCHMDKVLSLIGKEGLEQRELKHRLASVQSQQRNKVSEV